MKEAVSLHSSIYYSKIPIAYKKDAIEKSTEKKRKQKRKDDVR